MERRGFLRVALLGAVGTQILPLEEALRKTYFLLQGNPCAKPAYLCSQGIPPWQLEAIRRLPLLFENDARFFEAICKTNDVVPVEARQLRIPLVLIGKGR